MAGERWGEGVGARRLTHPMLVLLLLTAIYTCNFVDRQIVSVLAEPIKRDLHLSDSRVGLLTGIIFALFYSTLGIPLAWMSDRAARVRVVGLACTVWSLFCIASGFAGSFAQLALARIGVGAGEAGGTPPAHSLLSDYFPQERRGTVLAVYSLGVPLGMMLAALVGGAVASRWGWRYAFIAAGGPGLVVAMLALLVIREPPRGRLDPAASVADSASFSGTIGMFAADPVLRAACLAAAASAFVGYALNWMAAYLIRNKGMQLVDIAIWYSLVTGLGSAVGTFASGYLSDRLTRRHPGAYGLVPMAGHLIALPFFLCALVAAGWQTSLLLYIVPAVLANAFLPPMIAVVQNGVHPARRATASAMLLLALNLIGLGGGPLFVGVVSDLAAPIYGQASLTVALAALGPFFLIAALFQLRLARRLIQRQHVVLAAAAAHPASANAVARVKDHSGRHP